MGSVKKLHFHSLRTLHSDRDCIAITHFSLDRCDSLQSEGKRRYRRGRLAQTAIHLLIAQHPLLFRTYQENSIFREASAQSHLVLVERWSCLVSIFVPNLDLPIPNVSIECREECDFAERLKTFACEWYEVNVLFFNNLYFSRKQLKTVKNRLYPARTLLVLLMPPDQAR